RLAKGFDPIVSRAEFGFTIGKAIPMRVAAAAHGHVLMVSTGVMTTRALEAAKTLAGEGVDCTVLHMHTGKPLDVDSLLQPVRGASLVRTFEEPSLMGGLGGGVVDALIERGGPLPAIRRLGIPDAFVEHYGSQDDLMALYGLQPPQIAGVVSKHMGAAKSA